MSMKCFIPRLGVWQHPLKLTTYSRGTVTRQRLSRYLTGPEKYSYLLFLDLNVFSLTRLATQLLSSSRARRLLTLAHISLSHLLRASIDQPQNTTYSFGGAPNSTEPFEQPRIDTNSAFGDVLMIICPIADSNICQPRHS